MEPIRILLTAAGQSEPISIRFANFEVHLTRCEIKAALMLCLLLRHGSCASVQLCIDGLWEYCWRCGRAIKSNVTKQR